MWNLGRRADDTNWRSVSPPTTVTLHSVTTTSRGPHAVGGKGHLLIRESGSWHVGFDDGPNAQDRDLLTIAATDDGKRVWFGGRSGAFGYYDVAEGEKHDYSQPAGTTASIDALAVAGEAGEEKLLIGGDTVRPGYVEDCKPAWDDPVAVQGDGTVLSLTADTEGYGYATTNDGRVFRTTPNSEWKQLGIANVQEKLPTVTVTADYVWVGGTSGRLYRYDREAATWTTLDVADTAIRAIAGTGDALFAVGDGGHISVRVEANTWESIMTPTSRDLLDATESPDVAVGREGTVLEHE